MELPISFRTVRRANRRRRAREIVVLAIGPALAIGLVLAACSGTPQAAADPAAPCNGVDVQERPGFYPDLEAYLPAQLDGASPANRISGRYCSRKTLGTLLDGGIPEEQYAGATWQITDQSGVSIVVYRAPGLGPRLVADAFRAGAEASRNGKSFVASSVRVLGRDGYRLDVVNGDQRQVVVIWPSADGSVVHAVIGSDVAEERIQAAIAALG